ncbi:MAG: glycosyltransferase [Gammaproteobacteria bacterium]
MLCYYFPPAAASGSVRPASFCSYLHQFGYRPQVWTAPVHAIHPPISEDLSLLNLLPPDLSIEKIDYLDRRRVLLSWRNHLFRLRSQPTSHSDATPRDESASHERASNRLAAIRDYWVGRLFMFPDQQKDWARKVVRLARRIPPSKRPDVVFATGSPWSSLLAGQLIAEEMGVPYVADFRDPWARNLRESLRSRFDADAARLERQILASATRIVANTDALRDYFCDVDESLREKVVTINNGINKELLAVAAEERPAVKKQAAVELHYFGTISRWRMPRALLKALDELLSSLEIDRERFRVVFTGSWAALEPELKSQIERLQSAGVLEKLPAVSYDECIQRMRVADHLLILQQGYPLQIPAKTYEYLAMGRPIVVLGGEGATANLVESRRIGVICEDSLPQIKELIRRLTSGELLVPSASPLAVAEFHYENLTRKLAAVFDDAMAGMRQ